MTADELLSRTLLPLFEHVARGGDAADLRQRLPHADILDTALPPATSFIFDERESARNMISQLQQDCPSITASRGQFLALMGELYDSLHPRPQ